MMKPIYITAIKEVLIFSLIFTLLGMLMYIIMGWSSFFGFLSIPVLGVIYTQIKCLRVEKNSSLVDITIVGAIFLSCIFIVGSVYIAPSFRSFITWILFAVPILLVYFFIGTTITAFYQIFEKAGKPGWAALIPFYNIYMLNEIVNYPKRYFFLTFIPFLNIVYLIMLFHGLSKAFGRDVMCTVGLCLLGFIFFPLLAFGKYDYQMKSTLEEEGLELTKPVKPVLVEEAEPKSIEKERGLQLTKLIMSVFVEEVEPKSIEKEEGLQLAKLIMSAFVVEVEEVQPPSKA